MALMGVESTRRTKSDTRKRITIPNNYSGNAFGERERLEPITPPEAEETLPLECKDEEKGEFSLPFGIGTEELLLLGVLLVLSQSEEGGDILPFLLILLFLKSGK